MTAKEYLNQYCLARRELECLQEEIQELEALAEYVSPHPTAGGSSGVSDKVGNTAARIADKRSSLERSVGEALELLNEIQSRIAQLNDERHRWILRERYVHCRKWEHIARSGYYSLRTVLYQNQRALAAFEDRFPEIRAL